VAGRPARADRPTRLPRSLLMAAGVLLLLAVAGGLLRLGLNILPAADGAARLASQLAGPALASAAVHHAALMLLGGFGTVIGVERAVALGRPLAWIAPLASLLTAAALWAGASAGVIAPLAGLAALGVVAVHAALWQRQPAAHTRLLLIAATVQGLGLAVLVAQLLAPEALAALSATAWAGHSRQRLAASPAELVMLTAWFGFLLLTIAAERLEMTRLVRRHPGAALSLTAVVALWGAGLALLLPHPDAGAVLGGLAMMALALWLAVHDPAVRLLRTGHGLARYMAVCLLGGDVWLALAGLAWLGTALGCPGRDLAFHALGLGFVLSLVMAHAPVILPAVARLKLHFTPAFYAPWALLQLSLLIRLGLGSTDFAMRQTGGLLNALALVSFALVVARAARLARAEPASLPHPGGQA
jgi:hypothetical protein